MNSSASLSPRAPRRPAFTPAALVSAVTLALTACGGSDPVLPDAAAPPAAPAPVTLAGKVVGNQGIQGAIVCLDLNGNKACDADEPASAPTGADGAYSLVSDPAQTTAEQAAAAPLVASVPPGAVDAANRGAPVASKALTLFAPAGKSAQINPLTTLVQTGVASGLALDAAEAAVALQLGVSKGDLYDYQAQPALALPYADNARQIAQVVLQALDAGAPLSVLGLDASQADSVYLASLTYTDASNYFMRQLDASDQKGTGLRRTLDKRGGMTNGAPTADGFLYQSAYLSPTGWVRCDAQGYMGTRGAPSRSAFCNGSQQSLSYATDADVSGKSMGEVVRGMQAATDRSNTITMDATKVDSAVFPTGSKLRTIKTTHLAQYLYVNNLNSVTDVYTGTSSASLETFIKSRLSSNANLATNSGLTWVGYTGDLNHWLAATFLDETSKVQYYSCTFKAGTFNYDVCTPANQGTFSIVKQGGVRLIKFAGQPAPVDAYANTIGYGEYSPGTIVRTYEVKADPNYLQVTTARLNGTAWDALRKALNLPAL